MRASFTGDLRAPAHARHFVADQLESIVDPSGPPQGDDVVLIVSELVTNAVRAGAGTIDVDLFATRDVVELRVTDDASGWPTPRQYGADDIGGRGLAIVEELADSWKAIARSPGKTVTATWFRRSSGRR
jgi:anti-sigma regulatory factor (Ser/Thr protein kinase)